MSRDHLRLLHRHSVYGYTDRLDRALRDEPEAVSQEVQAGLTRDAHMRRHVEIRQAWNAERAQIEAALVRLEAQPWAKPLRNELRAIRAALERGSRNL